MSVFEYNEIAVPDDCTFKISPSGLSDFFEAPVIWYKDNVLGEKQFQGNTASVIGSCVHGLAELYATGQPTSAEIVEEYLTTQASNPDVNLDEVRQFYPDMAKALINEYIRKNPPTKVEYETIAEVKDGIYVGGTVDNRTGDILCDYKNVGKKPNIEKIPWKYLSQLMSYAWADKQRGVETNRIRIVYTVRPTATLPVRVFVVTHVISDQDWKGIEDTLHLVADTVLLDRAQPELRHLLFKSMKLKA